MIKRRHPDIEKKKILESLASQDACSSVQALLTCADTLRQAGWKCPVGESWLKAASTPCRPRMVAETSCPECRNSLLRSGHGTFPDGAGKHAVGQLPGCSNHEVRFTTIPPLALPARWPPTPLVCPPLPVWPSTRRPWPPRGNVRVGRGVGTKRLGIGVGRSKGLPGGRRTCEDKRFCSRHRCGDAQQLPCQTFGSGCRPFATFRRSAPGHRHNDGLAPPPPPNTHTDGSARQGVSQRPGVASESARKHKREDVP